MKQGKIIVIEGTDCSGKEMQTKLLFEHLKEINIPAESYGYPAYDTPTGKIIGGPYLGKSYICEGWFDEGAPNVDPKVASGYYAIDRAYNAPKINAWLSEGKNVLIDRYVESNMGHQGGKIHSKTQRLEMYKWLEKLEYEFYGLKRPDLIIFLHMPYEYSLKLKGNRAEKLDQHEVSKEHLVNAEKAYLELCEIYGFKIVSCIENGKIKTPQQIHDEVYEIVKNIL